MRTIWNETLKLYFDTNDEKMLKEITEKASIIAYTRILRRSLKRIQYTEEGKVIIDNCRKKLSELLPIVNSLAL